MKHLIIQERQKKKLKILATLKLNFVCKGTIFLRNCSLYGLLIIIS